MEKSWTVLYVVAQLIVPAALMIGGWGSVSLFANPLITGTMVAMALGALTVLHTGVNFADFKDRAQRTALLPALILAVLFFYFLPYADRHAWFVFDTGVPARYTGLLLFMVGTGIRTWGFLSKNERMALNGLFPMLDPETFTEHSIYARTRHPQYFGLWLQVVGLALVFRSWAGLAGAIAMLWPVTSRVAAEEGLMHERLGQRFDEYVRRSWRFFPGVY